MKNKKVEHQRKKNSMKAPEAVLEENIISSSIQFFILNFFLLSKKSS